MRHRILFAISLFIGCSFIGSSSNAQSRHPYASNQPINSPKPFEIPGVNNAYHITFTPDGKAFYFISGDTMEVICYSKFQNGKWSTPKVTDFSGKYRIETPNVSPDGKKFHFSKFNFINGRTESRIYVMDKTDSGWSEPKELTPLVSDNERSLTCTAAGDLYFYSVVSGKRQIYCSKRLNDKYSVPEALDSTINNMGNISTCFIAPDESFLLFDIWKPPADFTLYVSFLKNGSWSAPKNMGEIINTKDYQGRPCISPDGNYLFYTRYDSSFKKVSQYQIEIKPLLDQLR